VIQGFNEDTKKEKLSIIDYMELGFPEKRKNLPE